MCAAWGAGREMRGAMSEARRAGREMRGAMGDAREASVRRGEVPLEFFEQRAFGVEEIAERVQPLAHLIERPDDGRAAAADEVAHRLLESCRGTQLRFALSQQIGCYREEGVKRFGLCRQIAAYAGEKIPSGLP